jgi:hypothetical protein
VAELAEAVSGLAVEEHPARAKTAETAIEHKPIPWYFMIFYSPSKK